MANENEKKAPVRSAAETFRTEAEAEARQRALVAEARLQQSDRCPECGSLGSLLKLVNRGSFLTLTDTFDCGSLSLVRCE